MRWVLIAFSLLLTGCSSSDFAAFQKKATEEAAGFKNNEARLAIDGAGAVGLRAWARLKDPMEKCGLLLLSGIPCVYSAQSTNPPIPIITTPEPPQ